MASSTTQIFSSSTSTSNPQFTYDVFLSFRGEDTRSTFTDHLYSALVSNGIHTFRDDEELEKGGVIAGELLNAIEESRIFIIIFSKDYANSSWCLNELEKITECMTTNDQQIILPIFYHVDPSEVRKQTGTYGEAFADHEKDADQEKKEKTQKWRIALTEASNLAGYDRQKYQYESKLIMEIIDDILKKLNPKVLYVNGSKAFKEKKCGVHLIYAQDFQPNHYSSQLLRETANCNVKRSRDDTESDPAEGPSHKRLRDLEP